MKAAGTNAVLTIAVVLFLSGAARPPCAWAQKAAAGIEAAIVSPAEVSVQAAAELLFSPSPGVLTMRIPGPAPAVAPAADATIELTATSVDNATGAIVFSAPSESAGAMTQLISELTAAAESASPGPADSPGTSGDASSSGTSGGRSAGSSMKTTGTLNGQGVQVVVTAASQNSDGSGSVTAVITFD